MIHRKKMLWWQVDDDNNDDDDDDYYHNGDNGGMISVIVMMVVVMMMMMMMVMMMIINEMLTSAILWWRSSGMNSPSPWNKSLEIKKNSSSKFNKKLFKVLHSSDINQPFYFKNQCLLRRSIWSIYLDKMKRLMIMCEVRFRVISWGRRRCVPAIGWNEHRVWTWWCQIWRFWGSKGEFLRIRFWSKKKINKILEQKSNWEKDIIAFFPRVY